MEIRIPYEMGEPYVAKKLDLPQAEIDRLNAEKAELMARMKSRLVSDAPAKTDDGAPLVPALETKTFEVEPPMRPSLTGRITADGRKLSGLMSRAKKLEAVAEALGERANDARQAAHTARLELNAYMTENGLA